MNALQRIALQTFRMRISFIAWSLLVLASCRSHSDLPKLFPVPDAHLISDTGAPVSLASMKGSVTVYDFIYTHCGGTCPILSASMRIAAKKTAGDRSIRFVSISIDPEHDTPQVLHEYASHLRTDDRWLFLTGDHRSIIDLSQNGFKLAIGGTPQAPDPFLHSSRFAVADRDGIIRAYFEGTEPESPARVVAVARELERE